MRNIVKYVFIFFGLLFLSSFFFVDMTYGYVECYKPCSEFGCECGCQYASGCPYGCKQCTCPVSCSCGCLNAYTKTCADPTHPTSCTCGEYRSSRCTYSCNTVYTYPRTGCVRDANTCTSACECDTNYCVTPGTTKCKSDGSCACNGTTCPYGCNNNGSCKSRTNCAVYDSYCEEENGTGSYSIWSEISQSCVCVEPPAAPGGSCTGNTCPDGSCCPLNTTCQQFSGVWRCTDPEPPELPTTNTTPTSPTSLQTEGSSNPQTVTDLTPEFSAIFNDPDTGDTSNYYQIQVNTNSSFTGTVMWNSNKTSMTSTSNGSRSPQISYAGSTLTLNGSTYYWRIKFWDVGGLESPWSSTANFKMCTNVDCNPTQYCEDAGWSPAPLTSESILLEDVVKCTAVINCESVTQYGDCYEDPGIECTKDTDCEEGECCRGYTCTTDCTPVVLCNTDSECGADKCCVGGECGKCITPDTQSLRVIMGSKISDTIVTSLWDRILAVLRKLNTYMY